jgi:3-mercaptopyruvate sulfurtransferase SseA
VEKEAFEWLLGERGMGDDTVVVLYGDRNNWFAAYACWYLKNLRARGRPHPRRRPPEVDRRGT